MHNYYDLMERKDAKIITAFNEDVKFFTQLIYNDRYSRIDATAVDRKNRKCHLEIKQRTGKYGSFQEFLDKFDTIYLDCGKLDTFSNIMLASGSSLNEQELFVSIFDDGDTILIHNINQQQPMMWMPCQRVWNEGAKKWDTEHKVGLYWYNALIYQKQDGHYKRLSDEEIETIRNKQVKYSKLYNNE